MAETARRELAAAVVGAVGAGALALIDRRPALGAGHRRRARPPAAGQRRPQRRRGGTAGAGGGARAAGRRGRAARRPGPGRAVVGLLMAAAGGVLAWSGVRRSRRPDRRRGAARHRGEARARSPSTSPRAWPVLAVVAGLLGVGAGLLAVLRGRTWPAMGRRYERGAGASDRRGGAAAGDRRGPRPGGLEGARSRRDDPTDATPADPARHSGTPEDRCRRPPDGASVRRL